MSLKDYINEQNEQSKYKEWVDKLISNIQKDCKPFLSEIRSCKRPLYRGIKSTTLNPFKKIPVRQNRKPRDTHPLIHELLDETFDAVWGWKARSQGLFVQGDGNTNAYGEPYIIFPIGKFKYLWAWDVFDLWEDYIDHMYTNYGLSQGKIINAIKHGYSDVNDIEEKTADFVKDEYTDKNLCKALVEKDYNEVMILCKYYYAVEERWLEKIFSSRTGLTRSNQPYSQYSIEYAPYILMKLLYK